MAVCRECGKLVDKSYSGMCQGCYNYFRNGGTINEIPEHGRIKHDITGKVVCHICGRAYTRLGSHVKESHNMTIAEYKKEFGLCNCSKTTEKTYSNIMKAHSKDNKMGEMLIEVGKDTRIKKGNNSMRKNKEVRLQEILEKKDRGARMDISLTVEELNFSGSVSLGKCCRATVYNWTKAINEYLEANKYDWRVKADSENRIIYVV